MASGFMVAWWEEWRAARGAMVGRDRELARVTGFLNHACAGAVPGAVHG